MRFFVKWTGYVFMGFLALYLCLVIVGGGWGDKDPLPTTFTSVPLPLFFAHRGATLCYPDNSDGAIGDAARFGFPGIELDIQFSADSNFFIYHDPSITPPIGMSLHACSLTVNGLRNQRLSFQGKETNESPPLLADIVEKYNDQFLYYFDMKRYGHKNIFQLARDITAFVNQHSLNDRAIVASAHFWFIIYLEYSQPDILTALEGFSTNHPWLLSLLPRKFKPDFIASRQATITNGFTEWLRKTGMQNRYIVYHANKKTFKPTLEQGVQMFIIDYESYLDEYLSTSDSEGVEFQFSTSHWVSPF